MQIFTPVSTEDEKNHYSQQTQSKPYKSTYGTQSKRHLLSLKK